jgi:hypothetical protein
MSGFDEARQEAEKVAFCPVCVTVCGQDDADELGWIECNNCESRFSMKPNPDQLPDLFDPNGLLKTDGFDGAVIFCPFCSEGRDALGLGVGIYNCVCGQAFVVDLDAQKLATYSMFG